MKNKKFTISVVAILLIGTVVLSAAVTKSLMQVKSSENTPDYSYNHISVTGTPINNAEFIFGGGTYRDVNLKLKINIPVGWSIGLGGSGNLAENEFESDPMLRITSNNQRLPENGVLTSSNLIESITIEGSKYYYKGAGTGNFNTYASYEDAVASFSKTKNDKNVTSFKSDDILLANKYKAHKFDIEYKNSEFSSDENGMESQMRFRTLIYVDHPTKLYSIDVINTDFYNSPQVQEMLNSIEFYQ